MLKRILVGLDGSDYADSAIAVSTQIAKTYDATIVGLAIVDVPGIEKHLGGAPAGAIYYAEKEREDKINDAKKRTRGFLYDFKKKCEDAGVKYELVSQTGSPYEVIIEESKTTDLVIIGLRTFFHYETQDKSGETLKHLLEHTASPVLAVPNKVDSLQNVLLTYDGSVPSARAIRMRVHLTKRMAIKWTVLTVTDDPKEGEKLLSGLLKYLKAHEIDAETLVLPGNPNEVILEVAKKMPGVQVVMGAYSKRTIREWLFGSTAKNLIEDGTIPLFVYH